MTSLRFHHHTILHVVIQILIGFTALHGQVVRLPDRFEELTRTSFVADNGLYTTTGTKTLRYIPSTQRWVDVFPDPLLTARKSTLLFDDGLYDYLLSTDLGVTLSVITTPSIPEFQHLVRGDTVVVLTEVAVFARAGSGNSTWTRVDTDRKGVLRHSTDKVHWCDTMLAIWQPTHTPRLCFYTLKGERLPIVSSTSISSVSSTQDFILFNYNGKLSLTPTADTSNLFQIGDTETVLCQLGSKLIVISSSGFQAVTSDTGKTWTTRRVFPKQSLNSVHWFTFRDSLYITFRPDDTWFATDSTFTNWSAVNFTNPYPGTHWTICADRLLTWWRNSIRSTSSLSKLERPIIFTDDDTPPVAAVTTDRGTVIRFIHDTMYRSEDCGDSWDTTRLSSVTVSAGYSGGKLWRVDGGLHFSTDEGETWRTVEGPMRKLTPSSVSVHNTSYVFSDDDGLHLYVPADGIIDVHRPTMVTLPSYARFGDTSYIANYGAMYYLYDRHWLPYMAAPDVVRYQSLRPNDECYYGVDTAWRPIRWRPGGNVEYLDTVRITNAVITISGQYVRFSSSASGTYLYRHSPLTSTYDKHNLYTDPQMIMVRDKGVDLSKYVANHLQPPTHVSVYSTSGEVVCQTRDSWILPTDNLARGMYYVQFSNGGNNISFAMLVVDR